MPDPQVISLGCRLNIAESEAIRTLAGGADTVVVNSCAVTNAAVAETRKAIRRARAEHPGAQIVVTGCAAQIDPASFAAMPEVDRVLGNVEKLSPPPGVRPKRCWSATFSPNARSRRSARRCSRRMRAPSSRCRTDATIAVRSA